MEGGERERESFMIKEVSKKFHIFQLEVLFVSTYACISSFFFFVHTCTPEPRFITFIKSII
jgi:hypothetical protein